MSDKKHWITKIVPALAFAAGIIIASVGGIMTISSSLKLVMFDSDPYSYITEESCRYDYSKPVIDGVNAIRNDAEIGKCMIDRRQEEMIRFQKSQQENMIEGVSALIVGGILLLAFRRKK